MPDNIVITDSDGNEVFNSDTCPGSHEQYLADHPNTAFKVRIRSQSDGSLTFSGEMTAEKTGG